MKTLIRRFGFTRFVVLTLCITFVLVLVKRESMVLATSLFHAATSGRTQTKDNTQAKDHTQLKVLSSVKVRPTSIAKPMIKLQDSRELSSDSASAVGTSHQSLALNSPIAGSLRPADSIYSSLRQAGARPLALATADINRDGFPDLITGYATSGGGVLMLRWANEQAYAPSDPAVLEGIRQRRFPNPFFDDGATIELPEAPDFVLTGDFNHDGIVDVVVAAKGSNAFYLLAGDGLGGFSAPTRKELPGAVTAMTAGEFGAQDGSMDLVIGVNGSGGSSVLIFDKHESIIDSTPEVRGISGSITTLALGSLDGDQFNDLAILAGGRLSVLHGQDRLEGVDSAATARLESIPLSFAPKSFSLGNFIWDREDKTEIAVMSADNQVHILARGSLDVRPFTEEEVLASRKDKEAKTIAMANGTYVAPVLSQSAANQKWAIAEDVPVESTGVGNSAPILLTTRMSSVPADDLLVKVPGGTQIQVMYKDTNQSVTRSRTSGRVMTGRTPVTLDSASEPVAVLPMRVNVDGRPGLVVMSQGNVTASVIMPEGGTTITVNSATDVIHSPGCATTGTGTCSLRDAIIFSNADTGAADTIVFSVGINPTLTISSGGAAENNAQSGDLDINRSVTITGNAPTTVSTTFDNTCGDCKVFGIDQTGLFPGETVSMSGLTIQNGVNHGNAGSICGTFFETGGGIDVFFKSSGNSFTLTNSTVTNNRTDLCVAAGQHSHGGGINIDSNNQAIVGGASAGTATLTNVTVSNNIAGLQAGGIGLLADVHNVNLTNVTITGNQSQHSDGGGVFVLHSFGGTDTFSNGSVSSNTSDGIGGGVEIDGNQVVNFTGTTFTSNTATGTGASSLGGGLAITNIGAAGVTGSTSLTNCTIDSNHANNGANSGGGGVYFNGGYSLTISACDIKNNTGGQGGGIFNGGSNSSPGSTVTINNLTLIHGNSAVTTGGGNGDGGGIANGQIGGAGTQSGTIVTKTHIFGNTAANNGGGIAVGPLTNGATFSMSFSRIVNNTSNAATNHGIEVNGTNAVASVADNWWGCSQNPIGSTQCDSAHATSGTLTVTPFLQITNSAAQNPIKVGATTTLTATVQDSNGINQSSANLDVFITSNATAGTPLPVTWSAATNSITIDANSSPLKNVGGVVQVTATYNGTNPVHHDPAAAKVDNDFTTGSHPNVVLMTVLSPPSIAKAFGSPNVAINGAPNTTTLTFTITNPNVGDGLNGLAFTDTFAPGAANIKVASPPNASTTCGGGTVTAVAGSGSVSLSGGTIGINTTCTVTVTVQGQAPDGTANNTSGNVTATDAGGLTGNTASASTLVADAPTIAKLFGAATIPLNGTTSLTFTLQNTNANTALSGVAFSDTLPAGLTVATPGNPSTNCPGGTVTATNGSSSITLSGASLATGATCTATVTVQGTTAGVKNNTASASSTTTGALTNSTGTVPITVVAPPTISKAFGAPSIPLNGTTTMTFTITNPNTTVGLSGLAFSDTFPSGLQVAATPGVVNNCNGTFTPAAGDTTVSLSGGTVGTNTSCTITVNVTGTTAGAMANITGAISSTEGGTGTTSNTATLNVFAPPTISKAFGVSTIAVNGTTSLTFTITNPASNPGALTGIGFTDSLPAGLVVATPNGLSNTCNGTVTAVAGSGSITLNNNGSITTPGTTCTIQVNVTGTTSGVKNNTTGAISSTNGGTGATSNTATLTVASPPTISKAFGAATIPLNGTTSMTFTISNPNSIGLTGLAVSDTLPAGLVVATPNNLSNSCNGSVTATSGTNSVSLSGGTIAASPATCTVSVDVQGTTAGVKSNTTTAITSTESGPGTTSNTATVTVVAPPTISKAFGAASVAVNGSTTLTFTISNPNATVSLTGLAFNDSFPSGLQVASTPGVVNNCGGTFTANANATSVSLSGGTVGTGGSSTCTITVNVTGTSAGAKANTTGAVSSTEGGTGAVSNTATLNVFAPPTISKAFGTSQVPLGGTTTLTFTITNPAANPGGLTGIGFTDTLPAGLVVGTPNNLSNTCSGTVTATAGSSSISLNNNGSIATPGNTCTIQVDVTGTTSGVKNNTTAAITSTNGGTGATSNTATLTVASPPVISKSFTPSTVGVNGFSSLSFTIQNNNNAGSLTGVGFTDNLPANLVVFTPNGLSGSCGGGTISAVAGSSTISLTNATLPASSSCTFSVAVTPETVGTFNNTTTNVTSNEAGNGNQASATLTSLNPPSIAKFFGAPRIDVGTSTSLTFQIDNFNGADSLTGVHFLDTLPSGLRVATPNGVSGNCGGVVVANAGSSTISLTNGSLAPGANCSFSVNVTAISGGTQVNVTGNVISTNGGSGNTATAQIDTCSYVVSPVSLSYPISGGTGTVTVTPNIGTCSWTAVSNDSFVHITSGAGPTTGNGSVQFTVDNSGGTPRTGTMTIATNTVVVDQTNPTAINLNSFTATKIGSATLLKWQTGMEVHNLGFNIYRDDNGQKVQINPSLIAGSALRVGMNTNVQSGFGYSWVDHSGGGSYYLEDVDLNGTSTLHGPFSATSGTADLTANSMMLSEVNSAAAQSYSLQRGYPAGVEISSGSASSADTTARTAGRSPNRPATVSNALKKQWSIASQSAVKIGVNKTGWYQVNAVDLFTAGLDTAAKPGNLQMFVGGAEVPIKVNAASSDHLSVGDTIEFYGAALDTTTANTRVYWLTSGTSAGRRVGSVTASASSGNGGSFAYTVERQDKSIYFSGLLNGEAENWFGALVNTTPATQNLTINHLDQNSADPAVIEVGLQGATGSLHNVTVMLNGTAIQNINFNGQAHQVVQIEVPQSGLVEGNNTVSLAAAAGGDISLVDYVKITYAHSYQAENNSLFTNVPANQAVSITGFTSNQIRAIDVSNPLQPLELQGAIDTSDANISTISLVTGKQSNLIAFTPDQMLSPVSITANNPSSLNQGGAGANLVIIGYRDFLQSVQPLVALKQSQGYAVAVVDVEDIYDEFSYGVHSPQAVKDFLSWSYLHWQKQPQYVMLAGDASYDPKGYLGLGNQDFVPTKLIDTANMETASDGWLVDFNNDGTEQMAIGRLPVRTAADATAMVNKIVAYEQTGTAQTMVLVSDLNDGLDFAASNAQIGAMAPSQMSVVNIVRGQTTTDARTELLDQLSQGGRIVNYAGHGSVNLWRGNLLTNDDMSVLTNSKTSALVVTMTCLNAYSLDSRLPSLGEALLNVKQGGAVSVWASTAMTDMSNQSGMNQALFRQLLGNSQITIGDAIRTAKKTEPNNDVRRSWMLFGDPTMKIKQ